MRGKMNLIANVSENWGIGIGGELLVRIPEDMKFFRSMTLGKSVIMGRKTLESFPGENPLKNRTNIVITSDTSYEKEGAEIVHSVKEALDAVSGQKSEDVFIIGGESVYAQMLEYADTAYITKVSVSPEADAFFPNIDEMPDWELVHASPAAEHEGIKYRFCTYRRKVQ